MNTCIAQHVTEGTDPFVETQKYRSNHINLKSQFHTIILVVIAVISRIILHKPWLFSCKIHFLKIHSLKMLQHIKFIL